MPPEAVLDKPVYTEKIDCFSLGVITLQILTQQFPNPGDRQKKIQISHPGLPPIIEVRIPEIERRQNHISEINPNHALLPIALDCLKDRDVERPSAQQLCERVVALKEGPQYSESVRAVETRSIAEQDRSDERDRELRSLRQQHSQQVQGLQEIIQSQLSRLEEKDQTIARKNQIIAQIEKELREKDKTMAAGQQQLRLQINQLKREKNQATEEIQRLEKRQWRIDQQLKESRKGEILQSAYYSEAVVKTCIPFTHHYILECGYSGLDYTIEDHDITLVIPEGAVAENQMIHIEMDVTIMFGHFIFPMNDRPISPIVWLCLLEKDAVLKKPFQLILPHFLTGLTKDRLYSHQVSIAKASHHNCVAESGGEMKYGFNRYDSELLFISSGHKSYAVLKSEHCCFYCIQANQTPELIKDAGYCLTRVERSISPQRNEVYFVATYFLKACIQAIKEQFQKEGECTISRHDHFKFEGETALHIKYIPPDNDHHIIALEPSTAQIKASEIDFWSTPLDQLKLKHDLKVYPPRVKMTVAMTNTSPFKLSVKVTGYSSENQLDMDITFPLEVTLYSIPSGSQLLQCQSHTIVTKGDKPRLKDLFEKLLPLAADWNNIGVLLGIECNILREIKHNERQAQDRLREMLSEWLEIDDPPPTWNNLADALKSLHPVKAQEISDCIAE